MSVQNVRSRMVHRTRVERDQALIESSGEESVHGRELPDWQAHLEDQPCFLITRSGREAVAPEQTVVVDAISMLMPRWTDITPLDRLNGVIDRRGTILFEGILNVRSVLPHHSHIELALERAS